MTDTFRGYSIYQDSEGWMYEDGTRVDLCCQSKGCGHCGLADTLEGHDGCLGALSGVLNACCGHGIVQDAYVQLESGESLYGEEAVDYMSKIRKGNK